MNIKLLSLSVLLTASTSAFAQFNDSSYWRTSYHELDSSWGTIWAEYNPSSIVFDASGVDNQSFTGLSIGYSQTFPIVPDTGFCIEAGLGLQYSFYNEKESASISGYKAKAEEDFNMWSVKIPVNFLYQFKMGNSGFSLLPFAGLTLRYNFSAKIKDKATVDGISESVTTDLFKESDMGGSDYTWNRFQIGWQAGLKAIISKTVMIGASYGTDFMEIAKKTKLHTATITIGFCL